jgi:hypothetical protein
MDNRIWETKKKSGKAEKSDQQQQQVVGEEQQKTNRRRNWTRSTKSGSSLTKEGFSLNPAVFPNLLPSSAVPTDLIWCHVQWLDLWTSTRLGKHAEDQRIQVSVKPSAVRVRAVDIYLHAPFGKKQQPFCQPVVRRGQGILNMHFLSTCQLKLHFWYGCWMRSAHL